MVIGIYDPDGFEKHLGIIKEAKRSIDTDVRMRPIEAARGPNGRVLALQVHPPFACDHVLAETPAQIAPCLRTILLNEPKATVYRYQDQIAQWLGIRSDQMVEVAHV